MAQAQELTYDLVFNFQEKMFKNFEMSLGAVTKNLARLSTIAATANTAMYGVANSVAKETMSLRNLSRELGIATGAYQSLVQASREEGVSKGAVDSTLRSVSTARENFLLGGGDTLAWGQLGINPAQFRSTEGLLKAISSSLSKIKSDSRRINIMERLGISSEMLPVLSKSNKELAKTMNFYEKVGANVTSSQKKVAEDFTRVSSRITGIYNGLKNNLGEAFMRHLTPIMKEFSDWWYRNSDAIKYFIGSAVRAFSKFSNVMMAIFKRLSVTLGNFVDVVGGIEKAVLLAAGAFVVLKWRTIQSFLAMIAPALLLYIAIDDVLKLLKDPKNSAIGNLFNLDKDDVEALKSIGVIFDGIWWVMKKVIEGWSKIFDWIGYIAQKYDEWKRDQDNQTKKYYGNFGGGVIGEHRAEQGLTPTGGTTIQRLPNIIIGGNLQELGISAKFDTQQALKGQQ